jgi:hypothetical protein
VPPAILAPFRKIVGLLATVVVLLVAAAPASAIILYGNTTPPTPPVPADTVLKWNYNASAVAISSDSILTVRHPNAGVGTYVYSSTNTYVVAEVYNHAAADLRVARLTNLDGSPAVLTSFVPIYTGSQDASTSFVMGGYGVDRGTATGTGRARRS